MKVNGFIGRRIAILAVSLLAASVGCFAQSPVGNATVPEKPLTKKEIRKEQKKLKKMPLDLPELRRDAFKVTGGQRQDGTSLPIADSLEHIKDSLVRTIPQTTVPGTVATEILSSDYKLADSLSIETLSTMMPPTDGQMLDTLTQITTVSDSVLTVTDIAGRDTTQLLTGTIEDNPEHLSRRLRRVQERLDTAYYRHNPIFRDTIKPGNVTAISLVVPGFAQLYNGDYWKIPVLYGVTGTAAYFGIKQNQRYKSYKTQYEYLKARDPENANRAEIDPIQTKMIQHNTWRQLFFGAAAASYIYFLGDGILNYPGESSHVRKATMLSAVCPGAGQIYNKSYWRVPFFAGGFATFIYIIDYNDRVYQRYKTAYNLRTDGDPETKDEFMEGNTKRRSDDELLRWRNDARRNRDLAMILTAAFYLINIMDAHVDAQLSDFDVSDDLAMKISLEPTMNTIRTPSLGDINWVGMSLNFKF